MRVVARINERIRDAVGHAVCIDESGRIWIVDGEDRPYKQLSLHDIGKLDSFGALEWIDSVAQISLLSRHDEMHQTIEQGEARPVEIRRPAANDESVVEEGKRGMLAYVAGVSVAALMFVSLFLGLAVYKAMPYLKHDAKDGIDIMSRTAFTIDGSYVAMAKYSSDDGAQGFVLAVEGEDGLVDVYACREGSAEPVLVASDVAPKDLFTMAAGSLDGRYVSWGAKQADGSATAYLFDTKTMDLSSYSVAKADRSIGIAAVDLSGTVLMVVAGQGEGSYEAVAYNNEVAKDGIQVASWSKLDIPESVKPNIALSGKYVVLVFGGKTYAFPYTSIKGMSIGANLVEADAGGSIIGAAPSDSIGVFVIASDGAASVLSVNGKSVSVKRPGEAEGSKIVDLADTKGTLLYASIGDRAIDLKQGPATLASIEIDERCDAKGMASYGDTAYVVCQEGKRIVAYECKLPRQP